MFQLIALSFVAEVLSMKPVEVCRPLRDKGHLCFDGTGPSIQWYYDEDTEMCVPFRYLGCGGNSNRFKSSLNCELRCIPMDYSWCALKKSPYKDNGKTRICSRKSCPYGYICKRLAFFGICCPKDSEELFNKNLSPNERDSCVMHDRHGWKTPLLGKSCKDEFCPEGTQCIQQEILAYCRRPE